MNFAADLIFLAALTALIYAGVLALTRLPIFPLREVTVTGDLRQVTFEQVDAAAKRSVQGNFFTVDLDAVRSAFEKLPWVRRTQARRVWPFGIEVTIEEHMAVARWKPAEGSEARLVNMQGDVFAAAIDTELPVLVGPEGSSRRVLTRYREIESLVGAIHRKPQTVVLLPRDAWETKLDDGMVIELGQDQPRSPIDERLARMVAVYPQLQDRVPQPIHVIDLRYPNGFALRPSRDAINRSAQKTSSTFSPSQGGEKLGAAWRFSREC